MDFAMGTGASALRSELRGLIADHVPPDYLGAFTGDPADLEIAQQFCRTLAEHGLLCLAWPAELGGRSASVWEQTVVREEMWAHHEPRGAQHLGVSRVGPAIMRHGTPEQRRAHLPAIARGEVIWCQGFSEADADADAGPAALRAVACPVTDPVANPLTGAAGSGWRIDGQQIWTANALLAQWCFLLARTSAGEQAQQGLTVFLVPMSAPGIEVRPVATMLGPHRLNEVCFDGLHVTEADVLGEAGQGWQLVQEMLSVDRVGIAGYARCERLLLAAPRILGDQWESLPAELHARWARMLTHCRRARLLAYRVTSLQDAGTEAPAAAAAYRIAVARLDQESAEVLMDILGLAAPDGDGVPGADGTWFRGEVADHWRDAQATAVALGTVSSGTVSSGTVSSGSVETQRVLLASALLEPAERRDGSCSSS